MKYLIIFILFISLTGCDFWNVRKNSELPTIVTEQTTEYLVPEIYIDSSLLLECADLKEPPNTNTTFEDILVNVKENTIVYADCRAKHKSLKDIVVKSLNIKE